MSKIVIGIDPDGSKHGVAIYERGKLTGLHMYNNIEILTEIINKNKVGDLVFSIENVMQSNHIYGKHLTENEKVNRNVALKVGRCQQSQIELERLLDFMGVKYRRYAPSSDWKKQEKLFKRITGWAGRSNEDNRSAAFMGFQACLSLGLIKR